MGWLFFGESLRTKINQCCSEFPPLLVYCLEMTLEKNVEDPIALFPDLIAECDDLLFLDD
jgi:hypothetical protein